MGLENLPREKDSPVGEEISSLNLCSDCDENLLEPNLQPPRSWATSLGAGPLGALMLFNSGGQSRTTGWPTSSDNGYDWEERGPVPGLDSRW